MGLFDNLTKTIFKNPLGSNKAGTWNVLPAVLSTWSNLIQLQNQTSSDTYSLYKQQAREYIANAKRNADLVKKQEAIALRNFMYQEKVARDNDVLRVAVSNSNISGTHLDVVIRKEKLRKMNEMAIRANYENQAAMERSQGYNQAAQTYGLMYQTGRNVKWGVLDAILKGIGTYTSLTTRDAKVEQNLNLAKGALDVRKAVDAAQDAYYYKGIVPTNVTPNISFKDSSTPESLKLSGDTVEYSDNLNVIQPQDLIATNTDYTINFSNT